MSHEISRVGIAEYFSRNANMHIDVQCNSFVTLCIVIAKISKASVGKKVICVVLVLQQVYCLKPNELKLPTDCEEKQRLCIVLQRYLLKLAC